MNLILENIRTFVGSHEIPIAPLTILTGENSSGKTTFLASLAAITSPLGFPFDPKFNQPPYNLGSFDSIISRETGSGRAKSFALGLSQTPPNGEPFTVLARYLSKTGRIRLLEFNVESSSAKIRLTTNEPEDVYVCKVTLADEEEPTEFEFDPSSVQKLLFTSNLFQQIIFKLVENRLRNKKPTTEKLIEKVGQLRRFQVEIDALSIAPIRTKPERTYDPSSEHFNPEGTHIPYVLARALWERKSSKEQKDLIVALENFGSESGLFSKINVKNLGRRGNAPFQVQVNISGKNINLLDVGYGVSQSLPVIVESALAPAGKLLLIQQPEVHLHPKAQAALGSFFVSLACNSQKQFVIETHSDYIVDRIRQEVAKGNTVDHNSVSILYFERQGLATKVYPLKLDSTGNIIDAPAHYRDFFLREEVNLLTRTNIEQ